MGPPAGVGSLPELVFGDGVSADLLTVVARFVDVRAASAAVRPAKTVDVWRPRAHQRAAGARTIDPAGTDRCGFSSPHRRHGRSLASGSLTRIQVENSQASADPHGDLVEPGTRRGAGMPRLQETTHEPAQPQRVPVLHAVQTVGLPSETFIRDAIAELEALGWTPWLVTEASAGPADAVPPERIVTTPRMLPLVDRVAVRMPVPRTRDRSWVRYSHKYLAAFANAPAGVVHAHFGWTGTYCSLAARTLRLPLLVSFHGSDLTVSANEPVWREPYEVMLAQANHVTVVSHFLERKLRRIGYEGPATILPAGVRLENFPFSGPARRTDELRILFVGRLIACKGVDTLIDALARVRAEGVEATLRVVGDGPLRTELEANMRANGLTAAVRFLGALSHDEVRRELQHSNIVAVPSRKMPHGQEEGSPVVSKEAQAIGVPVVATDVGGIPETFPPEFRSELVPPDRPEALAQRIAQMWSEYEQWPARSQKHREWVESEFAWDKLAQRLSAIYDRLVLERPPSRASLARWVRSSRRGNMTLRLR